MILYQHKMLLVHLKLIVKISFPLLKYMHNIDRSGVPNHLSIFLYIMHHNTCAPLHTSVY